MSPSENKPEPAVSPATEPSEAMPVITSGDRKTKKSRKPKKQLSKKSKIILLVVGWLVLLGAVAGIALLTSLSTSEVDNADKIAQVYKFANNSQQLTDIVDDLDYYGYYNANPLVFAQITEGSTKGAYTISGLRDKAVEEKINNRIAEVARELYDLAPERNYVPTTVNANYFNILSLDLSQFDSELGTWRTQGLTFDLNTGNELSFDDLFSKDANLVSLLFRSFYNSLSTRIKSDRRYAAERLHAAEDQCPDLSNCELFLSPGETYEELRALVAKYDDQLANIDQVVLDAIQDYLAGKREFYLHSSGPVFILPDGTTIGMTLQDNIRYAVYLKNYRTSNSLFEDDSLAQTNVFFTELPPYRPETRMFKEETDKYLFDYDGAVDAGSSTSLVMEQAVRDFTKTKGLAVPGEDGKFRYINASSTIRNRKGVYVGLVSVCASETDKSYYDSVYRRDIVNNKAKNRTWELFYGGVGNFDPERVTTLAIDGNDKDCYRGNVAITKSGEILDQVEEILVDQPNDGTKWEDVLKLNAYANVCHRSWDWHCYSEEEKQTHEFIYSLASEGVVMSLKDNSEAGASYFYLVPLDEIPKSNINPEVLAE